MVRPALIVTIVLAVLAAPVTCLAEAAKALTNQDVVQMVKAGLPESTILLSIKNTPTDFKTAPTDLIALKKAGVSQAVLDAMLVKGSNGAEANGAMASATPDGVVAIDGTRRVELMMTVSSRFRTKVRPGMLMLGQKQIRMDILPGERSAIRLASGTPSFEVALPTNVNPGQLVKLVRLELHGGDREVAAGLFTMGPTTQKEIPQDVVPTTLEPVSAGAGGYSKVFRMTPTMPLAPGEYLVIWNGQYWDFGID
jgi:hypothetical protein